MGNAERLRSSLARISSFAREPDLGTSHDNPRRRSDSYMTSSSRSQPHFAAPFASCVSDHHDFEMRGGDDVPLDDFGKTALQSPD